MDTSSLGKTEGSRRTTVFVGTIPGSLGTRQALAMGGAPSHTHPNGQFRIPHSPEGETQRPRRNLHIHADKQHNHHQVFAMIHMRTQWKKPVLQTLDTVTYCTESKTIVTLKCMRQLQNLDKVPNNLGRPHESLYQVRFLSHDRCVHQQNFEFTVNCKKRFLVVFSLQ